MIFRLTHWHEINDFSFIFHWISASYIWMTRVWLLILPLERLGMWPRAACSLECLYPAVQPYNHETPRSMHSWLSCWDRVGVCVKADLESWKAGKQLCTITYHESNHRKWCQQTQLGKGTARAFSVVFISRVSLQTVGYTTRTLHNIVVPYYPVMRGGIAPA